MADYLSGELVQDTLARFEHHLSLCPNCQRYLAGYRATIAAGKAAFETPDAPLPADVPEELVQSILAARRRPG